MLFSSNPFINNLTLDYTLTEKSNVIVDIYDLSGRKEATLVDQIQFPGDYSVPLDLCSLNLPGLSIISIHAGEKVYHEKLLNIHE